MLSKVFSILSSDSHFVHPSKTILAILVKGHPRNIPVKLFWNRSIGLGGIWFKWFFYFLLWRPFCSAERNHFRNFSRESSKEYFCEIILKSAHWPGRRCSLKSFSVFSFDGHFVQQSGTILVEGHPRNISVKLFWNRPIGLGEDVVLLVFLFLALAAILFSRAEPF